MEMKMLQRFFLIFVCGIILAGGLWAQEAAESSGSSGKENAAWLDLFPLFQGFIVTNFDAKYSVFCLSAGFERRIIPHFSVGADLDMYFGRAKVIKNIPLFYMAIIAEGRYYPFADFEKLFVGAGLGLNLFAIDGEMTRDEGGFFGPTISVMTGYKLVIGGAFYAEPSIAYVLSKTGGGFGLVGLTPPTPIDGGGWKGGLRLGFMF